MAFFALFAKNGLPSNRENERGPNFSFLFHLCFTLSFSQSVPPNVWNNVCFYFWYPYHKEKCNQLRCTACTPSVMAADVVCKRTMGATTHKCVQQVWKKSLKLRFAMYFRNRTFGYLNRL